MFCTYIDYQLGRLMERMTHMGVLDNTLILFTSDHEDIMGNHHLHCKTYAYEGSARIPFLIRYPAGLGLPTGVYDHVVGLQDVMPTILEAAGVRAPDLVTGSSAFGAIRGEPYDLAADPAYRDRVVLWRDPLIELLAERGDGFSDGDRLLVRNERWSAVVE